MQNFLPLSSFYDSASVLDRKRLGNQRIETKGSIYICYRLKGIDKRKECEMSDEYAERLWKRYKNHPAIIMWLNHENALCDYGVKICEEWVERKYVDNQKRIFENLVDWKNHFFYPKWFGNEIFHSSHRSALLAKNYDWYKQFNWKEKPEICYYWPSKQGY